MLSERVKRIKPSPTLTLDAKAKELISKGEDIISFGAGEPDFGSPPEACEAGKKSIDEGKTKYTPVDGIPELKKAARDRFYEFFGVEFEEKEVIVSPGAKMAIYEALFSLVNEGEEVLIISPYWVSYPDMVKMVGGIPKFIETSPDDGFKPSPRAIHDSIGDRTRLLILNFPCNPTGAVAEPEIFKEISDIAKKKDIFVISDEIYATLVYNANFESFGKFRREKTIIIWGMSKTYSMTGWRIGFAFGPREIISAMSKVQSQTTSNPTSISQYAALEALRESTQKFANEVREKFKKRRDLIFSLIGETPKVRCVKPEGAFYIFPDVSEYSRKIGGTEKLSQYLLEEKKVLVIPGNGFGAEGFVRISFALSEDKIIEGIRRIVSGLKEL